MSLDRAPLPEEMPYAPEHDATVTVNPPPLVWPPVEGATQYRVQLSRRSDFEGAPVHEASLSHLVLTEPLPPGRWYWRYGTAHLGWSSTRCFTVPPEAVLFPFPDLSVALQQVPQGRPRLFVRQEELDAFRARWRAAPELTTSMYETAESFLGGPLLPEPDDLPPTTDPDYAPIYVKTFRATRPFTGSMHDCALAYLFSGDRRYGEEARRRLLHLMTWDPNGSTCLFHNDETAMEFLSLVPRSFDWIHDLLTEAERSLVGQVMRIRLGHLYKRLKTDYQFHARPYDSHAGRSLGFLGEGALAFIHEFPEAREWLEYILRIFWAIYPAWGGPEGGWSEGPAYWVWYMKWATAWCEVLRRATGIDLYQKPFFRNTPYFQLYGRPPYSKLSPFGDGQDNGVPLDAGMLMYRFASAHRDPYLAWYPSAQGAPISGMELFWYDPHLPVRSPAELPPARCFPDIGLACLHTRIDSMEENVQFLLRSSPRGSVSHSYADQNGFSLHAYGEPLAIASGYYVWYGSPHHVNWTWETRAANSITVDGQGQVKRSPLSRGRISAFEHTERSDYVLGDATEAYGGRLTRFHRHVLFLRPDAFVILDDLASESERRFTFHLHALEEMAVEGQRVQIRRGGARLSLTFLEPRGLILAQTDQFDVPPEGDLPNQHHLTATTGPLRQARFLTVLQPYRAGEGEPPQPELLPDGSVRVGDRVVRFQDGRLVEAV